jgi:hypothetical protein
VEFSAAGMKNTVAGQSLSVDIDVQVKTIE